MVLGRLVATERGQIGLMKAFGYSGMEVGLHYAKFVVGIVIVGAVIGTAAGTWLGRVNTEMYMDVFRFPLLVYRPSTSAIAIAISVSLASALLGSLGAVRVITSYSIHYTKLYENTTGPARRSKIPALPPPAPGPSCFQIQRRTDPFPP